MCGLCGNWEQDNARGYEKGVIALNFKQGVPLNEAQAVITSLLPPIDMPLVLQEVSEKDGYVTVILYVPNGQEKDWVAAFTGHPKIMSAHLIYPQDAC